MSWRGLLLDNNKGDASYLGVWRRQRVLQCVCSAFASCYQSYVRYDDIHGLMAFDHVSSVNATDALLFVLPLM